MEQEKLSIFGRQIKFFGVLAGLGVFIWFILEIKGILLPFVLAFVPAFDGKLRFPPHHHHPPPVLRRNLLHSVPSTA